MSPKPRPVPEGYHTVTPYLIVRGAAKAIDFYKQAFGATELVRMVMPDGRIGHAEIKIGDSPVMLADEMPEMKIVGPESLGGSSVGMAIYVEDCDRVFKQAVAAGARWIATSRTSSTATARGRSSTPSVTNGP